MSPIRMLSYVTHQSEAWHMLAEKQPSVMRMLFLYVMPLSIIPPLMLYFVIQRYPEIFIDILPGDRAIIFCVSLFVFQILMVLAMASLSQNLAEMVDIKPTFRDSLLLIAAAVTPFWLVSIFYIVPSFALNIILHGLAALAATGIVYQGIQMIYKLKRRGAATMLLIAIISTGALGFGVILVGSLMFWGGVQALQFALE